MRVTASDFLHEDILNTVDPVTNKPLFSPIAPKIAVVIGNGPSTKLLDFERVRGGHIATVGMNAAYRFWKTIDFRPTHYICMDTVVIKSHAAEIAKLVKEGRIRKFFLRDEIKADYPELANYDSIIWFDQVRSAGGIFETDYVTTGSWAIRWMLHEGMDVVATVGIDVNYVELIPEARQVSPKTDLRLEIVETPKFNPNYFFDGYQKSGDLYNVPNDPVMLRDYGSLVHVDSIVEVNKDAERLNIVARIIDLSPISAHFAFQKMSVGQFLKKTGISLVTSFRVGKEADVLENNIRIALANCVNPHLSGVDILLEGELDGLHAALQPSTLTKMHDMEAAGRLNFVSIGSRPSYRDLFEYANTQATATAIVANSDIIITPRVAQQIVVSRFLGEQPFLALTRWNVTEGGCFLQGMVATPPWLQTHLREMHIKDRNYFSYDAYVFDLPLNIPRATEQILLGSFGCDTALAGVLKVHGEQIANPCLSLPIIHLDQKPRVYDDNRGRADVLTNNAALKETVLERYSTARGLDDSLNRALELRPEVCWIGHAKGLGGWHALFRGLGATAWSSSLSTVPLQFKKIAITRSDLEQHKIDRGEIVRDIEKSNIFLEFELSGFEKPVRLVDLLLADEYYAPLGLSMIAFQWFSMVHVDHATPLEKTIQFDFLLILRDILGVKSKPQAAVQSQLLAKSDAHLDRLFAPESSPIETQPLGRSSRKLIILDPDGKTLRGHFVAYCDEMMAAGRRAGLQGEAWCRYDIDPAILATRPTHQALLQAHSWDISSQSTAFSGEIERALNKRLAPREPAVVYLYVGSLQHAEVFLDLSRKFSNVVFVCNLFWETVWSTEGSEFEKRARSVFSQLAENPRLRLTVPTSKLRDELSARFSVWLPIAPHPSTSVSDELFAELVSVPLAQADLGLRANVIFPGAATPGKGFDLAIETSALLKQRADVVCRLRNDPKGRLASGINSIPEHLSNEEFLEVLREADVIVLPYTPDGFRTRTSGIVIDALYLSVPVVACKGTWLGDFVEFYGFGVAAEPNGVALADAVRRVMSDHSRYRDAARLAAPKYFQNNSWDALFRNVMAEPDAQVYVQRAPSRTGATVHSSDSMAKQGVNFEVARNDHAYVDETAVIARLLDDRRGGAHVLVDVGAHIGSSAAEFTPLGWRVICFEPDPENRAKLSDRFAKSPTVTIDNRAVAETPEAARAFYASKESTGISGMLKFRDTHKEIATVEVTTVGEAAKKYDIKHIDFLKIDVEGYDFAVLKGVPWEHIKPDAIECEFEDAKTRLLGHTYKDIADYLVAQGYTVYLSEWYPIVRYGVRHDWRRIVRYPATLVASDAWGNILAFKEDPTFEKVVAAFRERTKFAPAQPEPPALKSAPAAIDTIKTAGAMRSAGKISEKLSKLSRMSWEQRIAALRTRGRSFYTRCALWIERNSPVALAVGRYVMWSLRVARRYARVVLPVLAILFSMVLLAAFLESYRTALLAISATIVGVGVIGSILGYLTVGVRHGYRKIEENLRSLQVALSSQTKRADSALKEIGGLKQRLEAAERASAKTALDVRHAIDATRADLKHYQIKATDKDAAVLDTQEALLKLSDELATLAPFITQSAETRATLQDLSEKVEALPRADADPAETQRLLQSLSDEIVSLQPLKVSAASWSKTASELPAVRDGLDDLIASLSRTPILNAALYQRFNRQIGEEHIKVLLEWAEKLNIEVNRAAVAVMAHRITQLETRMYGRLATSIQDALLRAMVTRAAGGQPRAVLEIGTLFGVGAAALHESLIFDKRGLHLTLIDPLDGYYGKNNADLLTSEPINEAVLRRNLAIAEIDPANVSIINLFSTDQAAIDMAGSQRYDVLIIDGDHSYDGVKHDFDAYSRFVNVGGYIIVDDYGAEEWPEIQRFVDETLKTSSSVEFVGAAWRTAVFRLLPAAQG